MVDARLYVSTVFCLLQAKRRATVVEVKTGANRGVLIAQEDTGASVRVQKQRGTMHSRRVDEA